MTALDKYARLEAAALWRAGADAQRVDVIVTLGEATLTIKDGNDRALAHWSLAAIARANPGQRPAIFHPDGDPGETVELNADEDEMIRAIEKLRKAVERARPQKGRLRMLITLAVVVGLGFAAYTLLPGAIIDHALRVVPDVKRAEIGNRLLSALQPVTGPPCRAPGARSSLSLLAQRLDEGQAQSSFLAVVRNGVDDAIHLPGGVILLSRALVEDHESPDVIAGYILAEELRRETHDPLRRLLEDAGTLPALRLLTSGVMPQGAIDAHARVLVTRRADEIDPSALLARFTALSVPSTPYGYAVDLTGESSLALIEGDPYREGAPREVLTDADWVRLQTICEG
ncbi:MAG: hypothetical protein AAF891_12170 [Pseudomonadota bacterium]